MIEQRTIRSFYFYASGSEYHGHYVWLVCPRCYWETEGTSTLGDALDMAESHLAECHAG